MGLTYLDAIGIVFVKRQYQIQGSFRSRHFAVPSTWNTIIHPLNRESDVHSKTVEVEGKVD